MSPEEGRRGKIETRNRTISANYCALTRAIPDSTSEVYTEPLMWVGYMKVLSLRGAEGTKESLSS